MTIHPIIDITSDYWLGDYCQNDGWKRLTLFHKKSNSEGGSVNTPIAEINIIKHPGKEGCNSHCEIKFHISNDINVVDSGIIHKTVETIKKNHFATLPISI